MNKKALETLEYHKIITRLIEYADFSASAELARHLRPTSEIDEARHQQTATREARHILSLDADVSFNPTYYENILLKFKDKQKLGLSGGIRFDLRGEKFYQVKNDKNSVGGPFQLFRRQCYDDIGGYQPLRFGGIDTVAETMARMKGWEVRSFSDFKVFHYRWTGTSGNSYIKASFKKGIIAYSTGYHPIFHFARCVFRLFDHPIIFGSILMLVGYCWAAIKFDKSVDNEFVSYLRTEQMIRLRSMLKRKPTLDFY